MKAFALVNGMMPTGRGPELFAIRTGRKAAEMSALDLTSSVALAPAPRLRERRRLTPTQIAGMLDERLYDPLLSLTEFIDGCRSAADAGVAAVVCPPSRVALAAHLLAPRGVQIAALASPEAPPTRTAQLAPTLAQTETLLHDGATEIGILAPSEPLHGATATAFAKAIRTLADLAGPHHALVKVLLPANGITNEDLTTACRISVDSGAAMVQGGAWTSEGRASLTQIALMRKAVGDHVLLKWSAPVANLDRLLVACAEGVDRFNADTTAMLKQAAERARISEIRIPERGRDY